MIGRKSRCFTHWLISCVVREEMRERSGSHVCPDGIAGRIERSSALYADCRQADLSPAARKRRNAWGALLLARLQPRRPQAWGPWRLLWAGGAPPKGRPKAGQALACPPPRGGVKAAPLGALALALTPPLRGWYRAGGWP